MSDRIHPVHWTRLALALAALAVLTACVTAPSLRDGGEGGANGDAGTSGTQATERRTQAPAGPLGGTSWRLVAIQSTDGSAHRPRGGADYRLTLGADGDMRLRADCNRGSGTWHSRGPGQLRFGAIATTRALCPEGSISERYLRQLPSVRSYERRDGHLFLGTGADGAVIELAPVDGGTGDG
ncbi:MAG: META domain-containing protein [Halofilum sp. (in: g-proteobacteria)]|nr:META domain-containing protein [Halofilum sp. (in: g-proteobacteria)]